MPNLSVAEFLSAHRSFTAPADLPGNLGDGFLMVMNPVYRSIREAAVAGSCRFVTEDYCGYRALPLAALPEMLKQGAVPYTENAPWLERIEAAKPGFFKLSEIPTLNGNNILHESCHWIAHKVLSRPDRVAPTPEGERELVIQVMLAEAFANTCEGLGNAFAVTDLHRAFYKLNSYLTYDLAFRRLAITAFEILGFQASFKLLLIGYLFSNFLYEKIHRKGAELALQVAAPGLSVSSTTLAELRRFFSYGFKLSVRFRVETATFYFRYLGINKELKALLSFNFLATIFKDEDLCSRIDDLAAIVELGRASRCRVLSSAPQKAA